ncbi:MAG: glycosyltransferase [Pseudomonadota bacterium]
MIFDQYSRYKACADLLRLAGFSPGQSVLDAGSGPECLFGQFMPDAAMTYVDPLIPGGSGSNHITGDVFAGQLDGQLFDCVSSVDVLEHVPPQDRKAMLQRLSSLSRHTLILGFPTSDSSRALETDRAIEDQYRAVYGRDYSWLEEHHKFGLPSLAETVTQLSELGWHCQSVGHGHAPWLQELLGFVICAWEIPGLKDVVLKISDRFNRELYPHDFLSPHYRQFVIATRNPVPRIVPPAGAGSRSDAEALFRALMEDAHHQYFAASMRQLVDREILVVERNAVLAERDHEVGALNAKIQEVSAWGKKLQGEMVERDRQVGALNAQVEKVSIWGKTLQDRVAERNAQIDVLNAKIEEISTWSQAMQGARDAALAEKDAALAEKDAALAEKDAALAEKDAALAEKDAALAEKDAALAEKDAALAARDAALAETGVVSNERDDALRLRNDYMRLVDLMRSSLSWRLTMPLRLIARIFRHGLVGDDRRRVVDMLRRLYHRVPLPAAVRYRVSQHMQSRRRGFVLSVEPQRDSPLSTMPDSAVRLEVQQSGLPDYIFWGVIDWHFRHQRPQQLAQALADSGRRVFYVSESMVDNEAPGFDIEPLGDTGRLFSIRLFVKGAPVIYHSVPTGDHIVQLRQSVGELLAWANTGSTVSMVQHPFWLNVAAALPDGRLVYDCMDHHEGFGNVPPEMIAMERALLASADLTITTSSWLDQIVAGKTANRAIIRNAGEFEHFARVPGDIFRDPKGRRVIGYYGAIAEWFDIELVAAIAQKFSDCCILLIGSDTVNAKGVLGKYSNVTFTGEIPYAELPRYLHAFDVCLLPFRVIPLTLATNPVKVYEYLSAGKPVVVVDLPEMAQFGDLVDVARNHDEYCAAIERHLALKAAPAAVAARQEFGRNQTWGHRATKLIEHVESAAGDPPVSVIVVTYNNIELTKACLASLDAHSHYGNIEIIVVDNASSDGSPEFLADWVKQAGNRKLILNTDNRGFAAANNQGLAIASGDYLVLLNNDTYVTPGWVRTMVNHMRRNTGLGLLGPVTNNIGNEARIEISYESMDEMLVRSREHTRRRIGRIFPLRTAAFFCVMIPRKTYEAVGPLDEAFGRGFFEDDDYCRRVEQLGLQVGCAEDVFIHHHLSASFNKLKQEDRQRLFEENKKIYEAKWGAWIPHTYERVGEGGAPP